MVKFEYLSLLSASILLRIIASICNLKQIIYNTNLLNLMNIKTLHEIIKHISIENLGQRLKPFCLLFKNFSLENDLNKYFIDLKLKNLGSNQIASRVLSKQNVLGISHFKFSVRKHVR
jgi:hypothetical protein